MAKKRKKGKKANTITNLRGCITLLAELFGIVGGLITVYYFLSEVLK